MKFLVLDFMTLYYQSNFLLLKTFVALSLTGCYPYEISMLNYACMTAKYSKAPRGCVQPIILEAG